MLVSHRLSTCLLFVLVFAQRLKARCHVNSIDLALSRLITAESCAQLTYEHSVLERIKRTFAEAPIENKADLNNDSSAKRAITCA